MKHIKSDHLGDFAEIYDDRVELISIARSKAAKMASLGDELIESRRPLELQWQHGASRSTGFKLPDFVSPELADLLWSELEEATEVLQKLLDCDRVGVRLATLRAPMCPRFHVDQVPVRMLFTIAGHGTEWIADPDADRDIMADRQNQNPPLRAGGKVRALEAGSWSLLKGGAWDGEFAGVVHRSPHTEGQRLFMSLDPIFSKAA